MHHASVTGVLNRWKHEYLCLPIERRQGVISDRSQKLDMFANRESTEVLWVVALGQLRVMSGATGDTKTRVGRQRLDQAVDALVGRNPSDEEHTVPHDIGTRVVALGICPAIDHVGAAGRKAEFVGRVLRDRQEAIKQTRQQPEPVTALQSMVGDDNALATGSRREGCNAARHAAHMMGMDEVGMPDCTEHTGCERVCRMVVESEAWPKHVDEQAAGVSPRVGFLPERHQRALDITRERARQFERVPLTATEDASGTEDCRSKMGDMHLKIALLTLGDPGKLTGGYLYHRRLAELARHSNAHVEFVSFPERPFPLALADTPAILRKATALGAQALVLDSIAAAYVGPWLLARRPPRPVVGMLHQSPGGIDFGALRTTLQTPLDRLAWSRARLLMVASQALMEELVADGVPRERLRVVPPGRDVASTVGPPAGDLRQGRCAAFLCVGNWLERKGILSLLDAVAMLPWDTATVHLVGDDNADPRYATRVRARLAQADLADRVHVHGAVPVERVAALYRAADVFVLPSLKEPYGTVYGEAMAFGLPVVGWRAGNLPHLAEDGREGLLIEPGNVPALANALRTLALDADLHRRLGSAARERTLHRPTWEQSAAMFFATVREAIQIERDLWTS